MSRQRPARSRAGVARWMATGLATTVLVAGCSGGDSRPWVVEQGPTADPGDFTPAAPSTPAARTDLEIAVAQIEDRLAAQGRPVQVLEGALPDGTPLRVEVLSLRSSERSLLLRLRLVPASGQDVELPLTGGLSGGLAEDDRSIADVELVDDATGARLLPTVYRADVRVEDPAQRCLCSLLPVTLPGEGVQLSAHYVRPEDGFDLVRVAVPGVEEDAPLPLG